jgi:hypothetical protein
MGNYILREFPRKEELIMEFRKELHPEVYEVNGHVHTPYSFSAFESIGSIFEQASEENIKVLGINDFFLADGFEEFYKFSLDHRIFPMFNIEIVGLLKDEQDRNFRINDPRNPGRIYLSGKGLDYPFELDPAMECMLHNTRYEIQIHVKEIIENVSRLLKEKDARLNLKFSEIKRLFARQFVTERHVARAILTLINERITDKTERKKFLDSLLGGPLLEADLEDLASMENEIRSRFLKAGGKAFVLESSRAFLPAYEAVKIILNAGGIPCYTVLLDDASGQCTEYEASKQILMNELLAHNIHCIEFIPSRNDPGILKDYAGFFNENGFIIVFGTAHSTPDMIPLRVTTRDGAYLDKDLKEISYKGACIIAAHQYLRAQGQQGYLDLDGNPLPDLQDEMIELGKSVITKYINQ